MAQSQFSRVLLGSPHGLPGVVLLLFVLEQVGVPVSGWIDQFFDQLGAVPAYAIAGGIVFETLQTAFAAARSPLASAR